MKYCNMTILLSKPRSSGLQPKPNQGPAPLGGIHDKLKHINDDLESKYEQLQEKNIELARKQLKIAIELNDRMKVFELLKTRQDNGRMYVPNSCIIGTEYQINKNIFIQWECQAGMQYYSFCPLCLR
jgi:hypothetical protein